jgi:hypothetical protein
MSWFGHLTNTEVVLLMAVVALLYGELFFGLRERKEAKKNGIL